MVVATQGHGDEEALERAVSAEPAFVGLVASRKRGEAVLGYLADRGVPRELLDRVRVPVGLDLGHTSHREIAVLDPGRAGAAAGRRRAGRRPRCGRRTALPLVETATAIDPVCGMTVTADAGQPPARARRDDVLLLLRGLPRPVRGRSRALPVHRLD